MNSAASQQVSGFGGWMERLIFWIQLSAISGQLSANRGCVMLGEAG
jgi:hypothetical protein